MNARVIEILTEEDNVAHLSTLADDVSVGRDEYAIAKIMCSDVDYLVTFDRDIKTAYIYGILDKRYNLVAKEPCLNEFRALNLAEGIAKNID